jgi:hypothetical protein
MMAAIVVVDRQPNETPPRRFVCASTDSKHVGAVSAKENYPRDVPIPTKRGRLPSPFPRCCCCYCYGTNCQCGGVPRSTVATHACMHARTHAPLLVPGGHGAGETLTSGDSWADGRLSAQGRKERFQ